MEFTKADYDERKARIDAGQGSDEDRRLVKLYERPKPSGGPVEDTAEYNRQADEAEAEVKYAEVKYADATHADLKAQAKERGLSTSGTKDELVARLKQADTEKQD
jgi:hypothetical protein